MTISEDTAAVKDLDSPVWDLDETYDIDPQQFLTKGRSTPFEGWTVKGRCIANVLLTAGGYMK